MGNYVTKDSKYYMITDEGLQLLREVDSKYADIAAPKRTEEHVQQEASDASDAAREEEEEQPIKRTRYVGVRRRYALGAVVLVAIAFTSAALLTDWQAFFLNAGVIASIAGAATIAASFLIIRYSYSAARYRGMMLSVLAITVLLAGLFVFSGIQLSGAAPAHLSDNSLDALQSSYSLQWQIR